MLPISQITVYQGSTFQATMTVTDDSGNAIDLTGYTVRGQIRSSAQSTTIAATIACTITTPASGIVSLVIDATQTAALALTGSSAAEPTRMPFDIEIVAATGEVTRAVNGYALCVPEVTK